MSAPAPLREVLDEVIEQFEEELSDPCTHRKGFFGQPACERTATHLVIHTCCGFEYKLCGEHARALRDFVSTGELLGLQCRVCKRKDAPLPEIVPLGGAL